MHKYIIFQAEPSAEGWENRKLQHTQALTRILTEHWDSSDKQIPEPGYRPTEFIRVEALHDPKQHAHSTHYRKGDWEVTRVETYTPDVSMGKYDMVVICYCKYNPINAPLKPMPERQVSVDSFGGDEEAYKQWLESQKPTAEV
ncbi:hypothetical protein [Fortiea contorta]|uniref:hypothetical protein n=1 Tax=Fortiea contorta TaxID=1892405 RepID=UPI00034D2EB1|nr:hypothetical protein [Fortiea contorta]